MQYFYDLTDPKNFIWPLEIKTPDGYSAEHQHTVLFPEGPRRHFCMTDSVMHTTRPNTGLHFHEHTVGYEIFFPRSAVCRGRRSRQNAAYNEPGFPKRSGFPER